MCPEAAFERNYLAALLTELLAALPSKMKIVLECRYGLVDGNPKTLEEVGEILGVTRERIRQIENKALGLLRLPSKVEILSPFIHGDDSIGFNIYRSLK